MHGGFEVTQVLLSFQFMEGLPSHRGVFSSALCISELYREIKDGVKHNDAGGKLLELGIVSDLPLCS